MNEFDVEFFFSFLILTFFGFYLIKINKSSSNLNLASFSVIVLSFFYGITPLYTFFQGRNEQKYSIDILIDNYLVIIFFIIGICFVDIFLFKKQEKRIGYHPIIDIVDSVDRVKPSLLITSYFTFFTFGYLIKNIYGFNFYGSGTLEKHLALPYEFFVFIQISEIFLFSILVWVIREMILKNKKNLYYWLILGTYVFTNFHSRSTLLWLFLIAFFILLLYNIKLKFKFIALTSFVIYFLLIIILPLTVGFRNIQRQIAVKHEDKSTLSINIEAFTEALNEDISLYNEISAFNIKDRLYFYDVNMLIIENVQNNYMYGELFLNSFYKIIPRFLNPNKFNEYGGFTSESLIVDHYNFYLHHDISDNLPIYGYIDFGFLGSFLAGIFLGYTLYIITKITFYNKEKIGFFSFCIFIGGFKLSMSFEAHYIGVFTAVRNLLLLLIIAYLFQYLKSIFFTSKSKLSGNPAYNSLL